MGTWRGAVAAAVVLALGATVPAAPAAGAVGDECPVIRSFDDVAVGARGVGLTVERGTEPTQFAVEVLGLLSDAVAPGRDVLLVEVSGPPIDRVGGIWAGMSGSPIYLDGEFVGALAYAFSGSSRVAGVTPATDMVAVGDAATSARTWIDVPDDLASRIGASDAGGSRLQPLVVPLSVGGVRGDRLAPLADSIARLELPWFPVAGSGDGDGPTTTAQRPSPGDNIAASLAIGDLDAFAVGTVSWVCGDRVVAFGHPFLWSGETTFGANEADAVAVISDPVFGAYKQASMGAMWGTIDQDRLAGIGGELGAFPATVPVTSTITDRGTGRTRDGLSHVVAEQLLADLAATHLIGNLDSVLDRIGRGVASVSASITGERSDGTSWTYQRTNRFADPWDVTYSAIWEVYGDLMTLINQPLDDVTLTGIDVDVEVDSTYAADTIGTPQVSMDGGLSFLPVDSELYVEGGQAVTVRVPLHSTTDRSVREVDVEVTLPDGIFGFGNLVVRAGAGFFDPFACQYDPINCVDTDQTFDDLLVELATRPRNDELVVLLQLWPDGAPPLPPDGPAGVVGADEPEPSPPNPYEPLEFETRVALDRNAVGERYVAVFIQPSDGGGTPGGAGVTRLSGANRVATALAVSEADFPFGSATVVVARADDPVDAFAAVPLAARLGAPMLLTPSGGLDPAVAEEVARLGATDAVVVGGSAAIGPAVEDGLVDAGITRIDRLAGVDRADTARRIALRLGATSAVVVDGRSADIAAAAGLAGLQGRAVLLADASGIPDATVAVIGELGIREATLIGGTSMLPRSLQDALEDLDVVVDRIAGADRVATAHAVARRAVEMGADPSALVVASASSLPDALVASRTAASRYAPMLLVGEDAAPVLEWIAEWGTRQVTIVGGTAAVPAQVEADLDQAVQESATDGGGVAPYEPDPAFEGG